MFPLKRFARSLLSVASLLVLCVGARAQFSGQYTANVFYEYVGCFQDQGQKGGALSYPYSPAPGTGSHSLSDCSFWAAENGYAYFALQNGGQCYGGNANPASMPASNQCNKPNQDHRGAPCGDSKVNSVYQFGPSVPYASGSYAFIGCYAEQSTSIFPVIKDALNDHGISDCSYWANSQGYQYFALQNGGQCRAGNVAPDIQTSAACSMDCAGESYFGGLGANAVYRIVSSVALPATHNYRYLGCYADGAGNTRTMPYSPDFIVTSTASINQCALWAQGQGLQYFALQLGGQCFGGNTNPKKFTPSKSCNYACANPTIGLCGDYYVNSVYKIAGQVINSSPAAYAYSFVGCYPENTTGPRVYPNHINPNGTITDGYGLNDCAAWAASNSYTYFALQFGGQCFGGNAVPSGQQVACSKACNVGQFCGGFYTNSIYELDSPSALLPYP